MGGLVKGSSPLARGLLIGEAVTDGCARIIPARAGFTIYFHNLAFDGSDHPRSRGVYLGDHVPGRHPEGSSPLARGLPLPWRAVPLPVWIIPARAGFTRG